MLIDELDNGDPGVVAYTHVDRSSSSEPLRVARLIAVAKDRPGRARELAPWAPVIAGLLAIVRELIALLAG